MKTTDDRLSRVASALVLFWRTLGPLWTGAGSGPGWSKSNTIARAHGYSGFNEVQRAVRDRLTPKKAWLYGF